MIIVEFMKDNYDHLDGNMAMIAIYLEKYKNEKLHLFCGLKHYENIIVGLKNNNINYQNIVHHEIKAINKIIKDYSFILYQWKIIKKIFNFAKKNNEYNLLFLFTTTFSLYYIKLFSLFNSKLNVRTVIHGDIEKIDIKKYVQNSLKNKILTFLYLLFFGLKNPLLLPTPNNLKFIIFGESIKNNVLKILPRLKNQIIAIPHPYLYNPKLINTNLDINKINIGVIGICAKQKNSIVLKKLINKLNIIKEKNFQILFSGRIIDDELYDMAKKSTFISQNTVSKEMLTDLERNETILKMDYAMFTYNLNSYKYTASGAFIDAINFEKPIIALQTDYIQYYFNKYGNIGYLCNSYEELEETLLNILTNPSVEEYKLQQQNIKQIKLQENIYNIAKLI